MAKVVPKSHIQTTEGSVAIEPTDYDLRPSEVDFRRGNTSRFHHKESNLLFISDPIRIKWDALITFLALYTCVAVPFTLSFGTSNDYVSIFDTIIDVLFLFDIYLNFITSYIDVATGEEITNKRKIATHYAKSGRLFADMIVCIPVDLLSLLIGVSSFISLIKLTKLLRVLRLGKTVHTLRVSETIKVPVKICIVIALIIIYLHLLTCSWHSLIQVENRWLTATQSINPELTVSTVIEQYTAAFYYSLGLLVQFEVSPTTREEYLFCMSFLLSGAMISSYLLTEVTFLVTSLNLRRTSFFATLDMINTTTKNLKLPSKLQLKVAQHFVNTHQTLLHHREWEKFQRMIPRSWVRIINLCMYKLVVQPIFAEFPKVIEDIVVNLEYGFYTPSMYLTQRGDPSTFFCLIVEGRFEVWTEGIDEREYIVNELRNGAFCGEVGLLYEVRRTATIKAVEYCNVGCISHTVFRRIVKKGSKLEEALCEHASQYKDPYRRVQTLRKVSYLHRLDPPTLDKLYYSLKKVTFDKGSMIYECGALATQLYFVLRGSLSVSIHLYDSELQNRVRIKHRTIGTELMLRNEHTLRKHTKYRRKKRDVSTLADLELVTLEGGSVLCGMLALFKAQLVTHCTAPKTARVLVLSTAAIEQLAQTSVQLRMAILRTKKMYEQFNSVFNDTDLLLPVIDCYKYFPYETPEEVRSWRALKRLRNAVVTVILRNRDKLNSKVFSKYALLRKLSAIRKAEECGLGTVAQKIEAGELPPSVVAVKDLLALEELGYPIMHQFALLLKKWQGVTDVSKTQLTQVEVDIANVVGLRKSVSISLRELEEIIDFIGTLLF